MANDLDYNIRYGYQPKPYMDLESPRNESRVEVEFEVQTNFAHLKGSPDLFPRGVNKTILYRSDYEAVERDCVETQWNLLENAKRSFQAKLDAYIANATKGCREHEYEELAATAKARCTESVEAEFFDMSRILDDGPRGIKPLKSIRVVRELPAPEDKRMADLGDVAAKVTQMQAGNVADKLAAQEKELAELRAMVADLKKGSSKKSSK